MRTYRSAAATSISIVAIVVASTVFTWTLAGASPMKHAPTTPVHHHALVHRSVVTVTTQEYVEWSRVAQCEQGGNWHVIGSIYSGGLGMTNVNWNIFGGLKYAPNAGLATPAQQILIAMRIQKYPPDQYGCTGSW